MAILSPFSANLSKIAKLWYLVQCVNGWSFVTNSIRNEYCQDWYSNSGSKKCLHTCTEAFHGPISFMDFKFHFFPQVDPILPPCNYCHHPWCVGDKSYHKGLKIMFSCDGNSDHASWNEVFHYWDTKLSWQGKKIIRQPPLWGKTILNECRRYVVHLAWPSLVNSSCKLLKDKNDSLIQQASKF